MDEYQARATALMIESMSTVVDLDGVEMLVLAHVPVMVEDILELVDDGASRGELRLLKTRAQMTMIARLNKEQDSEPF